MPATRPRSYWCLSTCQLCAAVHCCSFAQTAAALTLETLDSSTGGHSSSPDNSLGSSSSLAAVHRSYLIGWDTMRTRSSLGWTGTGGSSSSCWWWRRMLLVLPGRCSTVTEVLLLPPLLLMLLLSSTESRHMCASSGCRNFFVIVSYLTRLWQTREYRELAPIAVYCTVGI